MRGNGAIVTDVPVEQVREQILQVLRAWGMAQDLARTTADLMAGTDLLGIDSHGISMLPAYEEKLRAGYPAPDARPRVLRDGGASALIDGMGGLAIRSRRRPCTWPWTRRWSMAWARSRSAIPITSARPAFMRALRSSAAWSGQ